MNLGRGFKIISAFFGLLVALFIGMALIPSPNPLPKAAWIGRLENDIKALDAATKGNLGVYVKKSGTLEEMNYATDRDWYFASTVKVPVAIALLQLVEEGKVSLNQRLLLKKNDPVDGSGEVQFRRPGSKLSVSYLLDKMLTQSDSTATDMLINLIGIEELNRRIHTKMGIIESQIPGHRETNEDPPKPTPRKIHRRGF